VAMRFAVQDPRPNHGSDAESRRVDSFRDRGDKTGRQSIYHCIGASQPTALYFRR
jgi:hypothetical protein